MVSPEDPTNHRLVWRVFDETLFGLSSLGGSEFGSGAWGAEFG